MIVNPEREKNRFEIYTGRLLVETFGLAGVTINDPINGERQWTINGVYAPILGRAIGGIRVRVVDQKGFVSFVNQRDLEVMLGLGQPGKYCRWLGRDYPDPLDRDDWVGFFLDEEDLRDDLFIREQELRVMQEEVTGSGILPPGLEMVRRLHLDGGVDVEELLIGQGDYITNGYQPDWNIETVDVRWIRSERNRLTWREI